MATSAPGPEAGRIDIHASAPADTALPTGTALLSRLASNAYWLACYLERAENTARLLAAANALSLAPEAKDRQRPWRVAMATATDPHRFGAEFGPPAADTIAAHLLVDRGNPSSVVSCLRAVRENARSLRHRLTGESWEAINSTWLEAREIDGDRLTHHGLDHWLGWTRQRCQWIKGALDDQLRDDLYHVLTIGQAVERSDFTARLLVATLPALLGEPSPAPGTAVHREWEALLAAAGALDAYYRTTSQPLHPALAIELLMRSVNSRRSLGANAARLGEALAALGWADEGDAATTVARLAALLATTPSADLPKATGEALAITNALSAALHREHFMPSDR